MPKKPRGQAAADAAYLKNLEQMAGRVPVPEGTLAGQIDLIDGSIAGSTEHVPLGTLGALVVIDNLPQPPRGEPVAWPHIPETCTRCARPMSIESGWTPLKPREDRKIQCGQCAEIIVVPQGAYDTLALAISRRFANRDRYIPKLTKEKKSRGAG